MTELSPATREVYDAFNRVGLYNEPTFETDRKALAAALRAAAEIVAPLSYEDVWTDGRILQYEKNDPVREKLLAIATELETQ